MMGSGLNDRAASSTANHLMSRVIMGTDLKG